MLPITPIGIVERATPARDREMGLPALGSNQEKQLQRLPCCHYTNREGWGRVAPVETARFELATLAVQKRCSSI